MAQFKNSHSIVCCGKTLKFNQAYNSYDEVASCYTCWKMYVWDAFSDTISVRPIMSGKIYSFNCSYCGIENNIDLKNYTTIICSCGHSYVYDIANDKVIEIPQMQLHYFRCKICGLKCDAANYVVAGISFTCNCDIEYTFTLLNNIPMVKHRQKIFKHKCENQSCNKPHTVFATAVAPKWEYRWSCACGYAYIYDFNTNGTRIDIQNCTVNPIGHQPPKRHNTNFKYGSQTGHYTSRSPNAQGYGYGYYAKIKTLAEGYDVYEVDKNLINLSLSSDALWIFEAKQSGIALDARTVRFDLTAEYKVVFLQLPSDYIEIEYYVDWTDKKSPMKAITAKNYVGIYLTWCVRNSCAPLKHDVLVSLFETCVKDEDYATILDLIMNSNLKNPKDIQEALLQRLRFRIDLFKRVPSGTNMMLAYQLIEEYTLKLFEDQKIDMTPEVSKWVERFDKCKSIALNQKIIPEREVAFQRSLDFFERITKVTLKIGA